MIYKIGNQKLDVPETKTNGRARTPRQIVGWRDVAETCRNLDAVCRELPNSSRLKIVDGIARSGFWGKIFRNYWPDCSLHLNEENPICEPCLKSNFPNDKITQFNIHKWNPKNCDVSFLDFDHFTLRILEEQKDVLVNWSAVSKYFIFADGACFGFKFGNLKHYGCKKEDDYFYLLSETTKKLLGKRITIISKFVNAAVILVEDKKGKDIKFVPPSNIELFRGTNQYGKAVVKKEKGFGLL